MEHNNIYSLGGDTQHIWDFSLLKNGFKILFWKSTLIYADRLIITVITNARTKQSAELFIKNKYSYIPKKLLKILTQQIPYENEPGYGTKIKIHVYKIVSTSKFYNDRSPLIFDKTIIYTLKFPETVEMACFKLDYLYSPNHYHIPEFDYINNRTMAISEKNRWVQMLRERSKASMVHCNQTITGILEKNKGLLHEDEMMEQGMKILLEKKQSVASKRGNNATDFFIICKKIDYISNKGILIKFGCESEQGTKTIKKDYISDLQKITDISFEKSHESVLDILGEDFEENLIINSKLKELSGTLNEKITILSIKSISTLVDDVPNTSIDSYIHNTGSGDKVGGVIIYNSKEETAGDNIRNILHQLVTTKPLCLKQTELLSSILEEVAIDIRENFVNSNNRYDTLVAKQSNLEAITEKSDQDKKELEEIVKELDLKTTRKLPEKALPKAIEGAITKFKKNNSFEDQEYMFAEKDAPKKQTIKDYLKSKNITIFEFIVI